MIRYAGSEARAAHAVDAFQEDYAPVLVTGAPVDLGKLNGYYGTRIDPGRVRQSYPWYHFILERMAAGDALRSTLFGRHLKRVARRFPLCVSTYNFLDFGKPAIQCIADFSWDEEIRTKHDAIPGGLRGFFHRNRMVRQGYLGGVRVLSGRSSGDLPFFPNDRVIANSSWSAKILNQKYGMKVPVLYPPVQAEFADVSWEDRENGFVCIGRISPEKRLEDVIAILTEVRRRGANLHLHIIGDAANPYGERIKCLAREAGDWVRMEGKRFGAEKERLLTEHRYGIHACKIEAFGIAVAEMVKAGCIVFAPADGGQAEVVEQTGLLYRNVEDAAEKIVTALGNLKLQLEYRQILADKAIQFSATAFRKGLQEEVEAFQRALGEAEAVPSGLMGRKELSPIAEWDRSRETRG